MSKVKIKKLKTDTCMICKIIEPKVKKLMEEKSVDYSSENIGLENKYDIMSVPNFVREYDDGTWKLIDLGNSRTPDGILKSLEKYLETI